TSSVRRVADAIASALVRRSCPITAAWITQRAASRPAPVATASPTAIGPFATASRSISSPPARLIAPATPAPIQRWSLAAFAIASTSSCVMSPSAISSSTDRILETTRAARGRPLIGSNDDSLVLGLRALDRRLRAGPDLDPARLRLLGLRHVDLE